jgi:hypothetical protein
LVFPVILLVLLSLLVLFLCMPLRILILAEIHGHLDLRVRFIWLSGLFSHEMRVAVKHNKKHRKDEKKDRGEFSWLSRAYDTARVKGLRHNLWTLLKRLIHVVKIKSIDADVKYSIGDDYYTGMCAGLLMPLVFLLERSFISRINIQPIFEDDLAINGYFRSDFQVIPIAIIAPCLAFACSPAAWRAGKIWMKS